MQYVRSAGPTGAEQTIASVAAPAAIQSATSAAASGTAPTFAGGLSQSALLAAQDDSSGRSGGSQGGGSGASGGGSGGLTAEEQAVVAEMKATDAKVRAHEMAHLAAGGQFASGPTYEFQRGPDGGMYAVAGEVSIDTSPVRGDPAATIAKAEQVRAAAMAPAEPSAQDRKVAAAAAQMAAQASAELAKQQTGEAEGTEGGNGTQSATRPPDDAEAGRTATNPLDPGKDEAAARNAARSYDAVTALVAAIQQQTVSIAA